MGGALRTVLNVAGLISPVLFIAGALVYLLRQRSLLSVLLVIAAVGKPVVGWVASYAAAMAAGIRLGGGRGYAPWQTAYWSLETLSVALGVLFAVCLFLVLLSIKRAARTAEPST
jgi:hypothetical protein